MAERDRHAGLDPIHLSPTYYVGFVLDPDGHHVEFVCQAEQAS